MTTDLPKPDDGPGYFADWPMFGLVDDIRPAMRQAMAAGQAFTLVTLISADGGSPRPPGAQMLVTHNSLSGFLSGGCVEADVALHARRALADGGFRRLIYGDGSPWPDIRLLCGARIEILVEPLSSQDQAARELVELRDKRIPALWTTHGAARRCGPAGAVGATPSLDLRLDPFEVKLTLPPQRRLVVVGADPTALAIAQLGVDMGYETHMVRPRGPTAPPPVAGLHYHRRAAGEALDGIKLDAWSFVAVATHDTDTDEAALINALRSSAAYVGVLGARRRLPERLSRLAAHGLTALDLARLKAPIGLDLGGKSPFEIAVAVMAEITATANGAGAES